MMRQPAASAERSAWLGYARWLAILTIALCLLEGGIAMAYGWADESLSLFGFGVDSGLEVGSAALILWRLNQDAGHLPAVHLRRERQVTRAIGWLLLVLAACTAAGALLQLGAHSHPSGTLPAMVVSILSMAAMVALWRGKSRAAAALDSAAVRADAACSLACIQLSAVVLAGSLGFRLAPRFWWADAAAALAMCWLIGREGWQTVRAASKADFQGGCGCH